MCKLHPTQAKRPCFEKTATTLVGGETAQASWCEESDACWCHSSVKGMDLGEGWQQSEMFPLHSYHASP